MYKIDSIIQQLDRVYGRSQPLAELIYVEKQYYLFDSGTTRIIKCTKKQYLIFDKLLKGQIQAIAVLRDEFISDVEFENCLKDIIALIERENLFNIMKL